MSVKKNPITYYDLIQMAKDGAFKPYVDALKEMWFVPKKRDKKFNFFKRR